MSKKTICYALALSALFLSGCGNSAADSGSAGFEMKSLAEIRAEKESISALDDKFANLDLSETFIYVPAVDKIDGFSVVYDVSVDDKEKYLLDTAEWMTGEAPDENNIIYRNFDFEDIPYSECKDDPEKDKKYYFVYYKTDKTDVGINIGGSYIYAANKAVDEFPSRIESTPRFIDQNQDSPSKEFDMLAGENAAELVEVQDGEISVSEAARRMQTIFESTSMYNSELKLLPNKGRLYKVGDKYGINVIYSYEYNGVLLDYHYYGKDIETDKWAYERSGADFDASMVWKGQLDQLYGGDLVNIEPSGESCDEFISMEEFLSAASEKLTGNSKFTLDTVELLNGLNRVYPEEFYTASDAEKPSIHWLREDSHPIWVAYISQSGIAETPQMCAVMDAVTGEFKVYKST